MTRSIVLYFMSTWHLELWSLWRRLLYLGVRYVKIDIALVNAITCKNMFRHLQIFTAHSVNLWGMVKRTVGLMISCMNGQEIHIWFKERWNKREILHTLLPQEEETSTLVVDSEEEDEEEAWVEVKVRSFVIIVHSQITWQGTSRTLISFAAIATHLNMSLKIVPCC